MRAIRSLAGLVSCFGAMVLGAQEAQVLVTHQWLAPRLKDANIVVLHVAQGRPEYDAGHLPGARYFPLSVLSSQIDGLNAQLAPMAQVDSALEAVGVSDGQYVVLYGQPLLAARAFMSLERYGLKGKVMILDGGVDKWRDAGRAVSREDVSVARGRFTAALADNVVDAPWIVANGSRAGTKVLDARLPEFFLGLSPGATARAGHIPGATNLPFSYLTSELTTMRQPGRIRALFAQAGVAAGDTVVTYCHIGMQASLLYFAARSVGIPAKLYDGSWEDWAKRSDLPIAVGDSTKKP